MNQTDDFMKNASYSNNITATDNTGNGLQSFTFVVQMFQQLLSIVILICEVIAIRLLIRCKTIPYQCIQLSVSYLLSDIVGALFYMFYFLLIQAFDFKSDLVQNLQIILVSIMNNISSASLSAIILERVIALKANLNYILTIRRVKIHIIIMCIWLLHVILPICVFTVSYGRQCNFQLQSCDIWQVSRFTKFTCLAIMVAYDIVLVKANICVYKIAREHANKIDALQAASFDVKRTKTITVSERQYASIQICMKLVSVYVLLQTPMLVLMLIGTNFAEIREDGFMKNLRAIAYMLIKVCSVINMYLYIWKIKECKLFCYMWLAKYFKKFEKIAYDKRIEVYNIVVVFNKNDENSSS